MADEGGELSFLITAGEERKRSDAGDRLGEFEEADIVRPKLLPPGVHNGSQDGVGAPAEVDPGTLEVKAGGDVAGGKNPPVSDEGSVSRVANLGDGVELRSKGEIQRIRPVGPDDDGSRWGPRPDARGKEAQERDEAQTVSGTIPQCALPLQSRPGHFAAGRSPRP